MSFWTELDLNRNTATWIAHGLVGIVAVCAGFAVGVYIPGGPFLWAAIFGVLQACYFGLMREPADDANHNARGDSRIPGAQGVTPRVDMYGDQITNWGIGLCSVVLYLGSLWWGIVLIVALAITALLLTMQIRIAWEVFGGRNG
jgi:hypothetical protein